MNFSKLERSLTALLLCLILASCGSLTPEVAPTPTFVREIEPTPTFAPVPFITATATRLLPTASPLATLTTTPTVTLTPFDPIRRTPATLMLHRSNSRFDAVAFLTKFVEILKENDIHVITYLLPTSRARS